MAQLRLFGESVITSFNGVLVLTVCFSSFLSPSFSLYIYIYYTQTRIQVNIGDERWINPGPNFGSLKTFVLMTVCMEVAADAVYCRQTENIHLIPTGIPSLRRPFPRKGPIFPETVWIYVYFCCCLLIGTICCALGSQFSDVFFLRWFNSPTDEKENISHCVNIFKWRNTLYISVALLFSCEIV